MIPQVRKRGGLWVTGHGYLVQSHASFREAAESLGAVRRFRQQVKTVKIIRAVCLKIVSL